MATGESWMNDELVFYTNPMSRGRIVRWMLEEVGCPYRTELLDFGPAMKAAGFRAVNPMGKVPTIRHGETVVTECAAICAYLADVFPQAGLAPPHGSKRRGPYYRWLFFGAGPVEQSTTMQSLKVEVPPEQSGMVGYGSTAAVMDAMEGALKGRDYLDGEAFTAADLYLGSHIGWGMSFGAVEKRPVFEAYVNRLHARPAAVRAAKIDDDIIAAGQKQPAPAQ
jgi:glutathione S-transferase